jgi:hypothetical protein
MAIGNLNIIFFSTIFILDGQYSCKPSMNPKVKNDDILIRHKRLFTMMWNDVWKIWRVKADQGLKVLSTYGSP